MKSSKEIDRQQIQNDVIVLDEKMSISMYFKRTNDNLRVNIKQINEKNNVGYPV